MKIEAGPRFIRVKEGGLGQTVKEELIFLRYSYNLSGHKVSYVFVDGFHIGLVIKVTVNFWNLSMMATAKLRL
jgi:hypothetical protein